MDINGNTYNFGVYERIVFQYAIFCCRNSFFVDFYKLKPVAEVFYVKKKIGNN